MRVKSTPTTGYIWQVPELPAGVELIGSGYESQGGATPGSPVIHVFRFRASQPGAHDITFRRKREWEATAIETQTITVTTP